MKILNREPTEEMINAARLHHEGDAYLPHSLWQAMYDAAPEIKVDMEPVGWVDKQDLEHLSDFDAIYKRAGFDNAVPLYSADQLAALQAENERLLKEVEELKTIRGNSVLVPSNKLAKLTEERDELLSLIREAREVISGNKKDDGMFMEQSGYALAMHEGEKHG